MKPARIFLIVPSIVPLAYLLILLLMKESLLKDSVLNVMFNIYGFCTLIQAVFSYTYAEYLGRSAIGWAAAALFIPFAPLVLAFMRPDKQTVLDAVERGNFEKVRSFIRPRLMGLIKGIDVNVKNQNGYTALHAASAHGREDIAAFIIENGADLHARDKDGKTPLVLAALNNHKDVAAFIIENGADLHARDKDGNTPLVWAALNNHKDIADFLIQKGADVNPRNNDGITLIDRVRTKGLFDIAALLSKHTQTESTEAGVVRIKQELKTLN